MDKFYCACCKIRRKAKLNRHISIKTGLLCAVFSLSVSFVFFQSVSIFTFLLFFVFLVSAEIICHVRWRMAIVCNYCGFDPLVYLKSPEKAKLKVQGSLQNMQNDPEYYLLKNNPETKALREHFKEQLFPKGK